MRHIDITKNKPDQVWLDEAQKLTEKLIAIDGMDNKLAFIKKHQKRWKELECFLKSLSHNKCWYSESNDCASYFHIDHFRPKGEIKNLDGEIYEGYWWLAFEWTNYRLSGGAINTPKSSKFPVRPGTEWICSPEDNIDDEEPYLLDPTKVTDPGLLTFDEEGMPKPLYADNNWHKERVEISIKILNLKFNALVQARKKTWRECDQKINEAIQLIMDIGKRSSCSKRTKFESVIDEIKKMVSEDSPFSAVAQACVQTQGISWLTRMVFC